jgi:hypothetical protein
MTTTYQAAQDGGILEWILEIAGVPVRYYSGPLPPPAKAVPGVGVLGNYTDVSRVSAVGDYSERVSAVDGWYEGGEVVIDLATAGAAASSDYDPGIVLSRVTGRGAGAYAQVLDSIDSGAATFRLDRAWTGGAAGICHVGREAISYTYAAGPPTMTIVGRAVLGTWEVRHLADPVIGRLEECTDVPITWLGRPATLYYAIRYPGATTLSDPVPWAPCIITASPSFAGSVCSVRLAPISCLIDGLTGGGETQRSRTVELLTGVHRFYRSAAHVWAVTEELLGSDVRPLQSPGSAANQTTLGAADYLQWAALYWTGLATAGPGGAAAPSGHPRWGHMEGMAIGGAAGVQGRREVSGLAVAPTLITLGAPMAAATPIVCQPYDAREIYAVDLVAPGAVSADLVWPDGLSAALAARAPGTVAAVAGAWVDVELDSGTPALVLRPNDSPPAAAEPRSGPVRVWLRWSDTDEELARATSLSEYAEPLEGWDTRPERWDAAAGAVQQRAPTSVQTVGYPVRPTAAPDASRRGVDGLVDVTERAYWAGVRYRDRTVPVVLASGWYETGEPDLFVVADPGIPPSGCPLLVEWEGPGGLSRSAVVQASGPAVADAVAGVACYRIPLATPLSVPSVGQWPGRQPCRVTPQASWDSSVAPISTAEVLLQLLQSGAGSGAGYDVQPWGLAIPATLIDEQSFLAIPDPPDCAGWSMLLGPDVELREVIQALLGLVGYQVILRRGDGPALLAAVPVSLPAEAAARAALDETTISGLPLSTLDDQVVNRYRIVVREGEGRDELQWADQRSIAAHGYGEEVELDLRGIQLPQGTQPVISALLPVIARYAALVGDTRRVWRVDVPQRRAIPLAPGDAVLVTARDLYPHSGPPGVTEAVARVQSVSHSLTGAASSVELIYYGAAATVIHAAMAGHSLAGAALLIVEDYYTGRADPTRGIVPWLDVDDFRAGDTVWLAPQADPDAGALVVLLSLVDLGGGTWQVTLTAPHGIGVGTAIQVEHPPRAVSPARVLPIAYLSPFVGGGAQQYS